LTPTNVILDIDPKKHCNEKIVSNLIGPIFTPSSEKILREGRIIDDEERPEDMITRIVREYNRIEKEVFAHAA
jgi:hypothetical protein